MPRDVLEKAPTEGWAEFSDDPLNIGPQVPLVVLSAALSCLAERLAWVSGKQGVDRSGEWLGVECGNIVPDRRGGEVSGPLSGDKGLSGVFLPFDETSRVEARFCEHEAHIKATGSRAEGQSVSGR